MKNYLIKFFNFLKKDIDIPITWKKINYRPEWIERIVDLNHLDKSDQIHYFKGKNFEYKYYNDVYYKRKRKKL